MPVGCAQLHAHDACLATDAYGTDAQRIGFFNKPVLEFCQVGQGIDIIELSQQCGAGEIGHRRYQDDLAAATLNEITPHDLAAQIIAPFDQYIRSYSTNQRLYRGLLEQDDVVDGLQSRQHD